MTLAKYAKKADRILTHEIHITVTADTPATGKLNLDRQVPIALGMRVINLLLGNDIINVELPRPSIKAPDIRENMHPVLARKRGVRHCKLCGEPGHRRDYCPNETDNPDSVAKQNGYKPTPEQKLDIEDRLKNGESVMTVVSETGAPLVYVNVVRARLNRDGEL